MKKETFCKKFNLTEEQFLGNEKIGGYLDLRSVTSIPEGFNPTVGGDLYTKNNTKRIRAVVKPITINRNFFWKKDDKRYAKIDGIFCEILVEKQNGENKIFSAKKVNKNEFFFIVNKDSFYAHATDLKKATEDLRFKIIAETLKNEPINKDTMLSIQYYRTITGACEMGCKDWVEKNNLGHLTEIRADELLKLLEKSNAYGVDKFKRLVTF